MHEQNTNYQRITLKNQLIDAEKLFHSLIKYIKNNNIPATTEQDLRLALEETFINIVSYAYQDNQPHTIDIELRHTTDAISITFIDTGIAFNPLIDAPALNTDNQHFDGGMGIHLIKSLTNTQVYKRTNQTNVFTLTKHYTH